MPATSEPSQSHDNTALIGGVVGGVVALLIVVGVIAFIVSRNRKAKANQQSTKDGHSLSPPAVLARPSNSNYDRIDIRSPSHYSETANLESPTRDHYDSLKMGSGRNLILIVAYIFPRLNPRNARNCKLQFSHYSILRHLSARSNSDIEQRQSDVSSTLGTSRIIVCSGTALCLGQINRRMSI
jgi:hypothetical protein